MPSFPTPSQLFEQYKTILKSLKPSLNTNDNNSDFIIRGRALIGILSGAYGDQKKVNDDTYIPSARPEALSNRGADLGIAKQPATQSQTPQFQVTGIPGSFMGTGASVRYAPTGNLYTTTADVTLDGLGVGIVPLQAVSPGQSGNVSAPDTLVLVSPPVGFDPTGTLIDSLADGSDIETNDSYRARLLDRFQRPPAGGNRFDYPNFAFAADPSVRTALIRRFGRGLGTVDVYITTGTTDVDTAVTNGIPVVRVPSGIVLAAVQAYYEDFAPLTDCPKVFAPVEVAQNVTVKIDLAQGLTLLSVPADPVLNPLNLNVGQLIIREVGRALYKVPVGGRTLPGFGSGGFVVASDIENNLDVYLSAAVESTGLVRGKIPVLTDRQVQPLDPPNTNRALTANQLVIPGTITLVIGT